VHQLVNKNFDANKCVFERKFIRYFIFLNFNVKMCLVLGT